jgi:hypothetical protein
MVKNLRNKNKASFNFFSLHNLKMENKIVCFLYLFPLYINAIQVTINNLQPRYDIHGVIIDAHDGSIQQFEKNGLYYAHAMQYGLCEEPANYGCDGVSLMIGNESI